MWKICTLATSLTVFWLNLQLGLCDQFYDDEGDEMLSPCLGLYYLLPGLHRIMGEMYGVSLSGSLLPAFRPWRIMGEMSAVSLSGPLLPAFRPLQDTGGDVCRLLVWVSTTSFQTLLDNGGDVCRLLVWAFYYLLAGLLQDNEGEVCRLLVSSPVFTMASPWKFYLRLFGPNIQLSFWSQE